MFPMFALAMGLRKTLSAVSLGPTFERVHTKICMQQNIS
jgi:hypothetical protein